MLEDILQEHQFNTSRWWACREQEVCITCLSALSRLEHCFQRKSFHTLLVHMKYHQSQHLSQLAMGGHWSCPPWGDYKTGSLISSFSFSYLSWLYISRFLTKQYLWSNITKKTLRFSMSDPNSYGEYPKTALSNNILITYAN